MNLRRCICPVRTTPYTSTLQPQCPLWVRSGHLQCDTACPLCPRKQTFGGAKQISTRGKSGHSQNTIGSVGAGEGNRTLVCSLGSCRSTIELRPRDSRIANGLCARQARSVVSGLEMLGELQALRLVVRTDALTV